MKVFGQIEEINGIDTFVPQLPCTVQELKASLDAAFPKLQQLNYKLAVNMEIITDEFFIIKPDSELALLPPFSGG